MEQGEGRDIYILDITFRKSVPWCPKPVELEGGLRFGYRSDAEEEKEGRDEQMDDANEADEEKGGTKEDSKEPTMWYPTSSLPFNASLPDLLGLDGPHSDIAEHFERVSAVKIYRQGLKLPSSKPGLAETVVDLMERYRFALFLALAFPLCVSASLANVRVLLRGSIWVFDPGRHELLQFWEKLSSNRPPTSARILRTSLCGSVPSTSASRRYSTMSWPTDI